MAEPGLEAVAFPKLSEEQIEQLGRLAGAKAKKFRAGEALFRVGDRDYRFFVVKSGEVEILDESGDKPRTVTVHHPGSFTGDVNHLTGNPAVVSGIARTDCEVYEVSDKALREILNQDPRLSDIILQAFNEPASILKTPPRNGNHGGFIWLFFRAFGSRILVVVAEVKANECWIITGYWEERP